MTDAARLDDLARTFLRFADLETAGYSPLYDALSRGIAADPELIRLAAEAQPGQPVPNLFFGAVHYLLAKERDHALARHYPSLAPEGHGPPGGAMTAFREFALGRAAEVRHLLHTRRVQTNEVGRSACLMPAFAHVASLTHGPLALIEVGASAGLNLLPDYYHFDYGSAGTAGDSQSPVRLHCEARGARPPIDAAPAIGYRVGVDINVIDVSDPDELAWLQGLVWPEHHDRRANLAAAAEVVRGQRPRLIAGDGIALLPSLIEDVPADLPICVFHTFTMNQVTPESRERFYSILADYSWKRPIFEVTMFHGGKEPMSAMLEIGRSVRGEWRRAVLAECHAHGQWIRWLL